MAEQYQEGEVLKGSDGETYVVVGGVPREQVPVPATPGGVYKLPTSAKEQRDIRGAELAEEVGCPRRCVRQAGPSRPAWVVAGHHPGVPVADGRPEHPA